MSKLTDIKRGSQLKLGGIKLSFKVTRIVSGYGIKGKSHTVQLRAEAAGTEYIIIINALIGQPLAVSLYRAGSTEQPAVNLMDSVATTVAIKDKHITFNG